MKIIQVYNDDCGTYKIKPEEGDKATLKEMAVALIIASYDLASPMGLGMYRDHKSEMTEELAQAMLNGIDISGDYPSNPNKINEANMDYVNGRCCKTYIRLQETETIQCIDLNISTRDRNPKQIIESALQYLRLKHE
jgi:hypothetical protein